ncbi:MAG TPA: hypothetical protein VK306_01475 [Acidimicrobiales bacterium]|nr:hypothetical protein [Acidimicrobiales bacterium]
MRHQLFSQAWVTAVNPMLDGLHTGTVTEFTLVVNVELTDGTADLPGGRVIMAGGRLRFAAGLDDGADAWVRVPSRTARELVLTGAGSGAAVERALAAGGAVAGGDLNKLAALRDGVLRGADAALVAAVARATA